MGAVYRRRESFPKAAFYRTLGAILGMTRCRQRWRLVVELSALTTCLRCVELTAVGGSFLSGNLKMTICKRPCVRHIRFVRRGEQNSRDSADVCRTLEVDGVRWMAVVNLEALGRCCT